MMMIMIPMIMSKTIPEVLSKEVALIVVVSEKVFVKINSNSSWYKIALAMKSSLEGELFMRSWEWKGEKSLYMSCRLFAHGHKISQLLFSGGNCQDHSFSFSFFYE